MGGNILRVGYRMGFNTIEFVTGRETVRVSKKAKKGDIRLSDNWFSDNCPALKGSSFSTFVLTDCRDSPDLLWEGVQKKNK